jgi:hypothetical protein
MKSAFAAMLRAGITRAIFSARVQMPEAGMTDLYQAVLDDRDRLLEEIEKRDIRISELERALSLRDQLIAIEEGER